VSFERPSPASRLRVAALALVAAVGLLLAGPAHGADPDTPEALRNELLRGQTTGDWDGTLKAILERPAVFVGDALGPIFTNSDHARRLELVARVAYYLASHPHPTPKGPRILLSDLILRRALAPDGDAFLARLREPLMVDRPSGRRLDWDRLRASTWSARTPPSPTGSPRSPSSRASAGSAAAT
jgi:hypothetical protein